MKKSLLLLPILISILLVGCGTKNPPCETETGNACTLTQTDLTGMAEQTILAIKMKDFATLAASVSANGVRFSPYENVDTSNDIVLDAQQIANALTISAAYNRGAYDGSGEPIDLGIIQYRDKFVYDVDFLSAPEVYRNQKFERGNIINNIFDVYSGKQVVEYHFTGFDPQYDGMDRRSLYLIFDQENGARKLIGVVHGQRTI